MRKIGPVGQTNVKTYTSESALTRGYGATIGVVDGNATAITVAGARGLGIVAEDVAGAGYAASIVREGDAFAIAGGAIAYGDYLKFDAVGRVVTIAGTAGEEIVGRAECAAPALGSELIVFVLPGVR